MYQKSKTLKLSPISVKKTVLNSNCFLGPKSRSRPNKVRSRCSSQPAGPLNQTKLDPAALANRPGNWTKQS